MKLGTLAKRTAILGVAAIFAAAGAWADKPVSYASSEDIAGEMFDCSYFGMDFLILSEWTHNTYFRAHYDKDGNLVRINGFNFNTNRRAYNSNDPSKAIEDGVNMVGSPEHQHFVLKVDEGIEVYYKESGIFFKGVVPGYGSILMAAGTVVWESADGIDWVPIKITKNSMMPIEDWYPICALLQ